ncbi:MAG TPA: hypothetical protein VGJ82_02535 [Thermoanaerobaculia bacterium]|jgi:hypothetical protein
MLLVNPKINGSQTTVPAILGTLPKTNPTVVPVSGAIAIPPWYDGPLSTNSAAWHYQGVAPYNGTGGGPAIANGCISASSTVGYFSGFSTAAQNQNPTVKSVIAPNSSYYHLAGIQMLGDLLPVPLESKNENLNGLVTFYNVGNLASPQQLFTLTMPARKASATAITTCTTANGDEACVMLVYEYDHQQMYIYVAPANDVTSASAWRLASTYTGDAFQTRDEYQSFALVTQTNPTGDVVYVLGFREDEELWIWTMNTSDTSSFGQFTLVETLTGWNGSDWRNGMGLQIYNPTTMRLFGTSKDPSGTSSYPNGPASYTFNIYIYGA